jgi:hypothetical protein
VLAENGHDLAFVLLLFEQVVQVHGLEVRGLLAEVVSWRLFRVQMDVDGCVGGI